MKTFSIKDALNRGWELWNQNKLVLVLSTIISFVISNLPSNDSAIIGIIIFLFSTFIQIGFWKIILMIEAGGKPKLGELWKHGQYFLNYLGASIVTMIGMVIGIILLVVPGIYFFLRYNFAPLLILDRNLSIGDAFTESAKMSDGVKWKLLGFFLVALLVNIAGAILLLIGLLVAVPLTMIAYAHVYKKLSQKELQPQAEIVQ